MKAITRPLEVIPEYNLRSICSLEEMLLFDIETTGLKKETTQLYLVGCAYYSEGIWYARQWLTENTSDELRVLEEFCEFASHYRTLVHFNGDGFDIPYMQYKADYYMTGFDFGRFNSFDILKNARRSKKVLSLQSMSQKSIEIFLGINRDDQLNGGLLIPVYYDYEKSRSARLEQLLLLHNFDDIQGMLKILPILTYTDVLGGGYEFISASEVRDTAILEYKITAPVPVYCEKLVDANADILVCMDKDLLQINLKIYTETGRLPLANICDYYYLPEEDIVVHKDVGQFLDRSKRIKATKKNCFLKKDGRFIPQINPVFTPAFQLAEDKKRVYADWDELEKGCDKSLMRELSSGILHFISGC